MDVDENNNSSKQKKQDDEQSTEEASNSEEDEFNPTLAAMESEIKPKVLETVNNLSKSYSKLIKHQNEKLNCVLNILPSLSLILISKS